MTAVNTVSKIIEAPRAGNFTASNIHKLLTSPRKKGEALSETAKGYILEVLAEFLTGANGVEINAKALEWGKIYEPSAVEAFEAQTGAKGVYYGGDHPVFFKFEDMPLGCSPDYVLEDAVVEFKCPFNTARHVEAIGQDAAWLQTERKEYYAQVQLQMMVLDKPRAVFASYDPRISLESLRLVQIPVPADPEFQALILERACAAADVLQSKINTIFDTL